MVDVLTTMAIPHPFMERPRRHKLRAVMMRAGTSRGLFLHRNDLPAATEDLAPMLTAAMGSRTNDLRQIEGVGGATSTTSKVALVARSTRPGVDVDYTFVQVAVGQDRIDMSGNCGNMCSGVAAFALDEGLITAMPGVEELSVRVFNTNTKTVVVQTIKVTPDGFFDDEGDYRISGVRSSGSPIKLTFLRPSGCMTGKTFPTGQRKDRITVPAPELPGSMISVDVTMIDAANPFIFVDAMSLPLVYQTLDADSEVMRQSIESVRRVGAVRMGLATSTSEAALRQGTPKIALLSQPLISTALAKLEAIASPDIKVVAYSMGRVHPSLQLTGAVCLGVCSSIPGTVAHDLSNDTFNSLTLPPTPPNEKVDDSLKDSGVAFVEDILAQSLPSTRQVVIAHPSGQLEVEVDLVGEEDVKSATVFRTARRIFEGSIWCHT